MRKAPRTEADLRDFSEDCDVLARHIERHWDGTKGLRPKGWEAMRRGYTDYQGIQEWEGSEERRNILRRFRSFDDSSACSPSFVDKVALPHAMYDDTNQGRNPLRVLMGACVSHGHVRGHVYGLSEGRKKAADSVLTGLFKLIGPLTKGNAELTQAYMLLHKFVEEVGRGGHEFARCDCPVCHLEPLRPLTPAEQRKVRAIVRKVLKKG